MVLSQPPPILDQKVLPIVLEPSKGLIAQLLPVSYGLTEGWGTKLLAAT